RFWSTDHGCAEPVLARAGWPRPRPAHRRSQRLVPKALVTGGAGFIGSHLVERLLERGDHVTVLDDLSTGRSSNLASVEENPRFALVEGTVLDVPLVERLVAEADVVFHLAAAVGVDWVLRHPLRSLETNIQGTERVLRACAEAEGGRRL